MISLPSWVSGAYLLYVANYITILGIVFATVWTTNLNWIMRRMVEAGVDARTQSTMRHIRISGISFSRVMIPP
jgi:hypothetical protein